MDETNKKQDVLYRSILLFPAFRNMETIEAVRKRFDPLQSKIRPHLTLVFPFHSGIPAEVLAAHVRSCVEGIDSFSLRLGGVSAEPGGFLFLNVIEGETVLQTLHDRLYEGILKAYYPAFLAGTTYRPHLTLGRFADEASLVSAEQEFRDWNESFEDIITEVAVEIIDEEERSHIETVVPLRNETHSGFVSSIT